MVKVGGSERESTSRYVPELDGIRAFAILVVLAQHAGVPHFSGGFLGVDVFLVLSGYVITTSLLNEHYSTGSLSIRKFYIRRALRLIPALAAVSLACLVYSAAFRGSFQADTTVTAVPIALAYLSNWALAFGLHPMGLLEHTWSLSVEEQFYLLIAPLLFLFFYFRRSKFSLLIGSLVLLTGIVAIHRAFSYHGLSSVPRLYYGLDTRADGLLIGVVLAVLVGGCGVRPKSRFGKVLIQALSLGSVIALSYFVVTVGPRDSFLYRWGFTLVALLTAMVIYQVVSAPLGPVNYPLRASPTVFLGRVSYGVYLWNVPALLAFQTRASTHSLVGNGVRSIIGVSIAVLSYYALELRFLRLKDRFGGLRRPPLNAPIQQQVDERSGSIGGC